MNQSQSYQQKKYIKIEIYDTGIGMNKQEQVNLFNPFQQGNKDIQKSFGGAGLGLWLSKKNIEILKGTLDFETVKGKGTIVQVMIPIKKYSDQKLQ